MGAQVDRAELITIALNDSSRVFMVERYTDLTEILKSLSEESCNESKCAFLTLIKNVLNGAYASWCNS